MLSLNNIIKEIKNIPVTRLEELYDFVHSLSATQQTSESRRKKILSFAGSFNDMSKKEYSAFLKEIKKIRVDFYDRK